MSNEWKRGFPKGKVNPDNYEVYFSPGGVKWHRKKDPVSFGDLLGLIGAGSIKHSHADIVKSMGKK